MTIIRRFNFTGEEQITAQVADELTNHLWTAFAQNNNGICYLKKQSGLSPTQNYYSINRSVSNINALDYDVNNIYVAYSDITYLGEIFDKANPLTSSTYIEKGSFLESPIDVKVDNTNLWFLLPGELSGLNAKVLRYNTDGEYQETIDLTGITNAKSMIIDSNSNIWIVTYTNPVQLIRIFEISGGIFDNEITEIS